MKGNRKFFAMLSAAVLALGLVFGAGCTVTGTEPGGMIDSSGNGLEYLLLDDGTYAVAQGRNKYLSEIVVPDSFQGVRVTAVADYAFASCSNLVQIDLPDGIRHIGEGAFMDCGKLKEIFLPDLVESMGNYVFQNCLSLKEIAVGENNAAYRSIDGSLYTKGEECTLVQYAVAREEENFVLPAEVKHVGHDAFAYSQNLTSVTVGDGVTSIGAYAFWKCFALTSVTVGDGVTSIGDSAFLNCKNLKSVVLGKNVSSVDRGAFDFCPELKEVYYRGTEEEFAEISVSDYNDSFVKATPYWYSEEFLAGGWHYDMGGMPEKWDENLSQPPSNLEFWIAENVDDVDFSNYQIKYGMMGGTEYYGTGYVPTTDEDGQQVDPAYCVLFTVTSYPDYSSKSQHITYISITDPSIEVYGLTIKSTQEEIRYQMEEKSGFAMEELGGNTLVARKGDYTFSFSPTKITISVNVTNEQGIVF